MAKASERQRGQYTATSTEKYTRWLCGDARGTNAGFMRHYRNSDPPCDDCRNANREYQQTYRETFGLYKRRSSYSDPSKIPSHVKE